MKVGIRAGGLGSRLAEETDVRTKPTGGSRGDLVFFQVHLPV
jgi:hypothetical protein